MTKTIPRIALVLRLYASLHVVHAPTSADHYLVCAFLHAVFKLVGISVVFVLKRWGLRASSKSSTRSSQYRHLATSTTR